MEQLVGQTFNNRYQIVSLLGYGGMGAVLKARQIALERDVALKVLHPHLAEKPDFQQRFRQEGRAAAHLDHPGIVQVFDFGIYRSYPYIVMQLIEGRNLHQMLDDLRAHRQWIRLDEAIRLVICLASALDYAHRQGVLHRDIKPGNIMLEKRLGQDLPYQPIITDLGLARLTDGEQVTRPSTAFGTPAYMAPEQALGLPTDQRSDIYSLGVLLYELVVGRRPFPIETITEALQYHTKEPPQPPPAPRAICPDVPPAIEQVILKAIQRKAEDRYANAAELAKALEGVSVEIETIVSASTIMDGGKPVEAVSLVTQLQSRPPEAPPPAPTPPPEVIDRIQVIEQGRADQMFDLKRGGMTIGRDPDCDIPLSDRKISREHLRIDWDGQSYMVQDLNSTNGTFLGGAKLLPQRPEKWRPDQRIQIGDTWLRFLPANKVPVEKTQRIVPGTIGVHTSTRTQGLVVKVEPETLTVEPGSRANIVATILNQGFTVQQYMVSVRGVPPSWLVTPPPLVRLMNGDQQPVNLIVSPPRQSDSRAGRYPVLIKVQSQVNPDEFVEVSVMLTVAAYWQFQSELQPQRIYVDRPARVTIHNQGNTPEAFSIQLQDREEALSFRLLESEPSIPENQITTVVFTARPRQPRWIGAQTIYPFTVKIQHPRAPLQTHTGELVSQAWIPVWVLPTFLVFCLACLGLTARYLPIPPINPSATATATASPTPTITNTPIPGAPVLEEFCIFLENQRPASYNNCPIVVQAVVGQNVIIHWKVGNANRVNIELFGDREAVGEAAYPALTSKVFTLRASHPVEPLERSIELVVVAPTLTPTIAPTSTSIPPPPPTITLTPTPVGGGAGKIAFVSNRDGNNEIYVMNSDGSDQRNLTNSGSDDNSPAWSPRGDKIAFVSDRDGNLEIYMMDVAGGASNNLTKSADSADKSPDWSPDGNRIAFLASSSTTVKIVIKNVDGSFTGDLIDDSELNDSLSWWTIGEKIAFTSEQDGDNEIYVIDVNGSGLTNLTNQDSRIDRSPAWSPDGKKIAFVVGPETSSEIFVLNVNIGGISQLTFNNFSDESPTWSPDGTKIAFVSNRDLNTEIYIMDADGQNQRRLTTNDRDDTAPDWLP